MRNDGPCILRMDEVKRRVGVGRTTILEMVAAGRFPRPIKLTTRAVGWSSAEVDAWIAERIAARDAAEVA